MAMIPRLPVLPHRLKAGAIGALLLGGALLPIGCGYELQLQPTVTPTPAGAPLNVHQIPGSPDAPGLATPGAGMQFVPGSTLTSALPRQAGTPVALAANAQPIPQPAAQAAPPVSAPAAA